MKKFIGDKGFYKMIFAVALPIIIQNAITNFVSLLDNIMVGRLGTDAMTGVSIINQLFFVFNLTIFGAVSAAGIFTAQYYGLKDAKGQTYTFRFKLYMILLGCLAGVGIFVFFGRPLISSFIHSGSEAVDQIATMEYAADYMKIMLIGLLPYSLSQVYASTLRETGETVIPMKASVVSVVTNFVLNYVLIFGAFGLPALGVKGAAIATVVARFVELVILFLWTHLHSDNCQFIVGAYRSPYIPAGLMLQIVIRGLPLMVNELLWSMGVTVTNQCYSTRGLDALAAINIASTISNLFNIVFLSMGSVIAIIVGRQLGAGEKELAIDTDRKLIALSFTSAVTMGLMLIGVAPFFPLLYNTTETVQSLATYLIIMFAIMMPFHSLAHASYFTIRSGGQVFITILFDSVFMWVVAIPVAKLLSGLTSMGIKLLFPICHGLEAIKAGIGIWLVGKKTWVRRLVSNTDEKREDR